MDMRQTITLIDDDPAILLVLGDRLVMEGYEVIRARSGEEALDKIQARPTDLIILDIAMPGIGGLGFLKRLPDIHATAQIPVLVYTARAEMEPFFSDITVAAFLAKTAPPEQLLQTVRQLLNRTAPGLAATGACSRTIMLVEDDTDLRQHLSRYFKRHGLEVWEVPSAQAVLEQAAVRQPHVILLKFILPHHSGPALAEHLRKHPPTRDIPLILYDDSAIHPGSQQFAHVDAFVPNGKDEHLLKAINTVLSP